MRKKILFVLSAMALMFGAVLCIGNAECWMKKSLCKETTAGTKTENVPLKQKNQKLVEVGNDYCPVMGIKLEKGKEVKYLYKGNIYNFCCPSCVEQFKKNPEKYIKIIAEQKKKAVVPEKSN